MLCNICGRYEGDGDSEFEESSKGADVMLVAVKCKHRTA